MNSLKEIMIGSLSQLIGTLLFISCGILTLFVCRFDLFTPINNFQANTSSSINEPAVIITPNPESATNTDTPTSDPTERNTNTPTDAPTATHTDIPTNTPTATHTDIPTNTPTNEPTATETPSPVPTVNEEYETALERAWNFTGTLNRDWTPYSHTFEDGVEMVLVPVGCFIMGSTEPQLSYALVLGAERAQLIDEEPVQSYCNERPFWIDKTETTQGDFRRLDGVQESSSEFGRALRPIKDITWFEAHSYCLQLGKRLPTEAEWEYAARGVESWIFPWGNEFVAENVIYRPNSQGHTADANSLPNGASWVGAVHMTGNVSEWTSSLFMNYPYNSAAEDATNQLDYRVVRGGSWYSDSSIDLRSARRTVSYPHERVSIRGFRCVLSV